jgi:hypothetical protein
MEVAAYALNQEYGCNLSWGQVANLLTDLTDEMEAAKKKPTSTLESLDGME